MPKILVIDDSPSALKTVEMILSEAGHEVCTCTDGKRALQILKSEAFDLIITDLYMPDRDGLEVIRERRQIDPDVPIVAMSGVTGQLSMLAVAKCLGACQILPKPFSKEELLEAVCSARGTTAAARPVSSGDLSATDPETLLRRDKGIHE